VAWAPLGALGDIGGNVGVLGLVLLALPVLRRDEGGMISDEQLAEWKRLTEAITTEPPRRHWLSAFPSQEVDLFCVAREAVAALVEEVESLRATLRLALDEVCDAGGSGAPIYSFPRDAGTELPKVPATVVFGSVGVRQTGCQKHDYIRQALGLPREMK